MLISKKMLQEKVKSQDCSVWEYNVPSANFSFATAKINKRHPESGTIMNNESEHVYYVISGSGIIHSQKGDFTVHEGDAYFFSVNEKYWIEADNLFVAMTNCPPWNERQYVRSEE